jgi:hypothetical protein
MTTYKKVLLDKAFQIQLSIYTCNVYISGISAKSVTSIEYDHAGLSCNDAYVLALVMIYSCR